MEIKEAANDILNDLVKINNDRIAGYERAINETKDLDIDLKSLFVQMIEESKAYKAELSDLIQKNEGVVEDETTSSGKIYRAWMDIKATVTDSDRLSILAACEFGEDAAQRAYESALASDALLDPSIRGIVEDEKARLGKSHDLIKRQREAYKALSK
jgi:uncharacterized protein (TIGR02284 family)